MALLQVNQASKRFGGLQALKDFSLEVQDGSLVGIIGPNGAGKTTLFNVIAGALALSAGSIVFDGHRISNRRPDPICRLGVARTFQIARPLNGLTALENTMIGGFLRELDPAKVRDRSLELLDFVGMSHLAGKIAGDLTAVDSKRLELARALATRPRLLMLDEVFVGLNPAGTKKLMGLVREINQSGVTILLIEHVMRAVMNLSEQVVVLDHGIKLAEGPPAEVAGNQAVIEAYLGDDYA